MCEAFVGNKDYFFDHKIILVKALRKRYSFRNKSSLDNVVCVLKTAILCDEELFPYCKLYFNKIFSIKLHSAFVYIKELAVHLWQTSLCLSTSFLLQIISQGCHLIVSLKKKEHLFLCAACCHVCWSVLVHMGLCCSACTTYPTQVNCLLISRDRHISPVCYGSLVYFRPEQLRHLYPIQGNMLSECITY